MDGRSIAVTQCTVLEAHVDKTSIADIAVLTIPGKLSPSDAERLREQWRQAYSDPHFAPEVVRRDYETGETMTNILQMPPAPKLPDLLIGPFTHWCVQVEGRIIPRLTAVRDGDKISLIVDGRFAASFAEDDARQAAWLIAEALAIGEGYSHLGAESKDVPFAPLATKIEIEPHQPQHFPDR